MNRGGISWARGRLSVVELRREDETTLLEARLERAVVAASSKRVWVNGFLGVTARQFRGGASARSRILEAVGRRGRSERGGQDKPAQGKRQKLHIVGDR